MESVAEKFSLLTKQPADFLAKNPERSQSFRELTKFFFDFVRTAEQVPSSSDLLQLLSSPDFDDEQVWQQLELDNRLNVDHTVMQAAALLAQKSDLVFFRDSEPAAVPAREKTGPSQADTAGSEEGESGIAEDEERDISPGLFGGLEGDESGLEEEEDDDEAFVNEVRGDDDGDEDEEKEEDAESEGADDELTADDPVTENSRPAGRRPKHTSIVDDEFFNLDEMNEFLLEDEKRESRGAGDSYDYFVGDDEEDEEGDYKYTDFFDPPPNGDDNEAPKSKEADEPKSSFEKRQEKLKAKIQSMEEEAVSAKPWQLSGEISAVKRPENSLLEEYLQFDHVTRQPPVITEEVSQKLEDLILLRIKDKAWDDVQRKVKPKDVDPYEFKKKLVIDETKSKQSLSQIYEQEYLNKIAKNDKEEEKEEHRKIRTAMNSLFVKLDALSNFHFVPKPVAPDIKMINNLPTLLVEEVQPSAVSTSQLLAPEEVRGKQKGELKGTTEATSTDKKRARRKKKLRQKVKALRTKSSNHVISKDAKKDGKSKNKVSGTSSTVFFDKLQDTVKKEMSRTDGDKESRKRKPAASATGLKKFRL